MVSSESFTLATIQAIVQHMKLQNKDGSSSFFDEPLNIAFVSTVAVLASITCTVGIMCCMGSLIIGTRTKR